MPGMAVTPVNPAEMRTAVHPRPAWATAQIRPLIRKRGREMVDVRFGTCVHGLEIQKWKASRLGSRGDLGGPDSLSVLWTKPHLRSDSQHRSRSAMKLKNIRPSAARVVHFLPANLQIRLASAPAGLLAPSFGRQDFRNFHKEPCLLWHKR